MIDRSRALYSLFIPLPLSLWPDVESFIFHAIKFIHTQEVLQHSPHYFHIYDFWFNFWKIFDSYHMAGSRTWNELISICWSYFDSVASVIFRKNILIMSGTENISKFTKMPFEPPKIIQLRYKLQSNGAIFWQQQYFIKCAAAATKFPFFFLSTLCHFDTTLTMMVASGNTSVEEFHYSVDSKLTEHNSFWKSIAAWFVFNEI